MSDKEPVKEIVDVPQKILMRFLSELKKVDTSSEIASRLEKVILAEGNPSEESIRSAVFPR